MDLNTSSPVGCIWLNKIIFYTAVMIGCVMAFSPAETGLQPALNDKFLHTTGFMIMALLAHMAHPNTPLLRLIIGLSLLGMAIELIQACLPYRDFSLWDWCADVLGIVLYFQIIALPLMRFLNRKFVPD